MAQSDWIRSAEGALINLAAVRKLDLRPVDAPDSEFEVVADDEVIWSGSHDDALHIIKWLAGSASDLEEIVATEDS